MSLRFLTGVFVTLLLAAPAGAMAHEWVAYFEPSGEQLSPDGYRIAREVAAFIAEDPEGFEIVIVAHEDAIEARDPGRRTDLRRGRAMMLELGKLGVAPAAISISTRGVSQLAKMSDLPEPLNRRVYLEVNRDPPPPDGRPRPPPSLSHTDQPRVFFDEGSAELGHDAIFSLRLSMLGHTDGGWRVIIRGRTDSLGDLETNRRLSLRRAEAVARVLAREGLPWADFEISGAGESELAKATADEVSEPANRSVSVNYFRKPDTH